MPEERAEERNQQHGENLAKNPHKPVRLPQPGMTNPAAKEETWILIGCHELPCAL
jgi:hypothetical protein